MDDKQRMYYWRNQKMKVEEVLNLLKNIKKEMNIQPAEKVINKHINIYEEALEEAIECYEFYLGEEIKDESII